MFYPVLIQIYDDNEVFRFPVVVVIKGNKEREPISSDYYGDYQTQICENKNNKYSILTYDNELNPVEADISFKCFNEKCDIGRTKISGPVS